MKTLIDLPPHPDADPECETCRGTAVHGDAGQNLDDVERCDVCNVFNTDWHARAYAWDMWDQT